jgi:hypothetical protein
MSKGVPQVQKGSGTAPSNCYSFHVVRGIAREITSELVKPESAPGRTRTCATGSGGRCSIR